MTKRQTERATGVGRKTREDQIQERRNQMTALRFQTGVTGLEQE